MDKKRNGQRDSQRDCHDRRRLLKGVLGAAFGVVLPISIRGEVNDERQLSLYHTHTRRNLDTIYKRNGDFVSEALDQINTFLGDFRTGDVEAIDPGLLDILFDLREALGSTGTYEVISAYRSPKTNEMLRRRSGGVARKSQHLLGKAIDVRLTDVGLETLRDAAIAMQRGGVGFYAKSNFVHIDTGPVRRW